MAEQPRTKMVPVTHSTLEALSWAVWFSAPSCPAHMREDLDEVSQTLMQKRREFRSIELPATAPAAPEPVV